MLKIAGFRGFGAVTHRGLSIQYARSSTRAERTRADGVNKPRSVDAEHARPATDAEKLRAAGLHQPVSVAGLTNTDAGLATMAERMRADGIT